MRPTYSLFESHKNMLTPELVQTELSGFLLTLHDFENKLHDDHPDLNPHDVPHDLYYFFKFEDQQSFNLLLQKYLHDYAAEHIAHPFTALTDGSVEIFDRIKVASTAYGLSCTDSKTGVVIPHHNIFSFFNVKPAMSSPDTTINLNAFFHTLAVCFIQQYLAEHSSPLLLWQVVRSCRQIIKPDSFTLRDTFKMIEQVELAITEIIPKTALLDLALKCESLSVDRFCEAADKAGKQPLQAAALMASGSNNFVWHKFFHSTTDLDQPSDFHQDNCISEYGFYSKESLDALFNLNDLNVFDIIASGISPLGESSTDQGRILLQWLAQSKKYNQIGLQFFDHLDYQLSIESAFTSRILIERNSSEICLFLDKAMDLIQSQYDEYHKAVEMGDDEVEPPSVIENHEVENLCKFLFFTEMDQDDQWQMPNLKVEFEHFTYGEILQLAAA